MKSTKPLKVWCGIWHQDVSGRSFKSSKLPGESAVDLTQHLELVAVSLNLVLSLGGHIILKPLLLEKTVSLKSQSIIHNNGKKKNTYIRLPHQDCSFGDALT